MAVSSDDILSTGPEPLEDLYHGVPVEGLHRLLDPCTQFFCEALH